MRLMTPLHVQTTHLLKIYCKRKKSTRIPAPYANNTRFFVTSKWDSSLSPSPPFLQDHLLLISISSNSDHPDHLKDGSHTRRPIGRAPQERCRRKNGGASYILCHSLWPLMLHSMSHCRGHAIRGWCLYVGIHVVIFSIYLR